MPRLFVLCILFIFFGGVCGASLAQASTKSSQIPPFISIPLIKLHPYQALKHLDPSVVHQRHIRHGAKRLEIMSGTRMERRRSTQNSVSPRTTHDARRKSDAEVTKAHNTAFPHSAPLDIEANDIGYLATFFLGTPPQPFRLLVDSGSADMWVGGEQCRGDDGGKCGDHKFLGKHSSSSFRDSGRPWYITYGSGTVSGNLVEDHVAFAGFTLRNHTFGVASNESSQFIPDVIPLDGIFGCAKQRLSIQQTPTFLNALRSAGLIAKRILSYKISRDSDGKNDGEITVGGMDPTKYNPLSLVRVGNVNTLGFWEAKLDTVEINGRDVRLHGRTCIFDTGTTLLLAPKRDVDAIHRSIPGAKFDNSSNGWTVPCTTNTSISLVFRRKSFSIRPVDLTFLPLDPKNPRGACTSAIAQASSEGATQWLVGDTFLKNVYLSTNEDKDEISLAQLAR
ncbi:aspartic peptidase domain-containing protein [Mycena polygramma]|nr:aspartic peptidase domain-containing protein [Mycena polygramma]